MFCQATGLPQSTVADRVQVFHLMTVGKVQSRTHKPATNLEKNTLKELRRKRLKQNKACKN